MRCWCSESICRMLPIAPSTYYEHEARPGLSNLLQPAFPPRQFLRQLVGQSLPLLLILGPIRFFPDFCRHPSPIYSRQAPRVRLRGSLFWSIGPMNRTIGYEHSRVP